MVASSPFGWQTYLDDLLQEAAGLKPSAKQTRAKRAEDLGYFPPTRDEALQPEGLCLVECFTLSDLVLFALACLAEGFKPAAI